MVVAFGFILFGGRLFGHVLDAFLFFSSFPPLTLVLHSSSPSLPQDVFISQSTHTAAITCVSGVLESVRRATSPSSSPLSVSISRPPGHHACCNKAMGFCFLNNVAIAAKEALRNKWAKRVAIVDWDVHHGNGTQELTWADPSVLYLSLHRLGAGPASFYPGTGKPEEVGAEGAAEGTNVNIAFSNRRMEDHDYAAAWAEVVLPVVAAFAPDLILVSAGLDAAKDDLIGDCSLSPYCYHLMTKSLLSLASPVGCAVSVVLEGGYNLDVIPLCMEAICSALAGLPFVGDMGRAGGEESKNNKIALTADRLVRARLVMTPLWDYYEKDPVRRGLILGKGCSASINRTVKALAVLGRYKSVGLRPVLEQADGLVIRTRKQNGEEQGEGGGGDGGLLDMFGKMAVKETGGGGGEQGSQGPAETTLQRARREAAEATARRAEERVGEGQGEKKSG